MGSNGGISHCPSGSTSLAKKVKGKGNLLLEKKIAKKFSGYSQEHKNMARVKIKSQNAKDPARRTQLLEALSRSKLYITRIIPTEDGFSTLTNNDEEMDKIFNDATKYYRN